MALADALMTRPGDLDDRLVADLRATFTPQQVVEIALKTMKFNVQKIMVGLGTDDPVTRDRLENASWNRDGTYVLADPDTATSP